MSINAAPGSPAFSAGSKKQNGEINLLRLIFAFIIMLNHFNDSFKIGVCSRGAIAVEFFFLVTGFLLAAHISKELQAGCSTHPKDITRSSFRYTLRKIKTFYVGYIINILLFVMIVLIILRHWHLKEIIIEAFRSIPVFTLTFMGFNATSEFYISGSWYLSVVVISVFLLYPFLKRYYYYLSRIILPVIAVIGLSWIFITYGKLNVWYEWHGGLSVGLIRGFCEISFGVFLFELSSLLKDKCQKHPVVSSILKICCFLCSFWYMILCPGKGEDDLFFLPILAFGVLLSFSDGGLIPDNKITRWTGEFSLYLYLTHGLVRYGGKELLGKEINTQQLLIMLALSILISLIVMYLSRLINRKLHWSNN